MLTLEPPYYELRGVLVYRDHAIPHQFYYTAPSPKISREKGQLMFDLLTYAVELKHSPLSGTAIPDELGAGFLTMGVDCALSDSQRATLARDLASRAELPEERLALFPIPYSKGSVRVLALDQFATPGESVGDPASAKRLTGRPTFVEKVVGAARPSLLGDLRAIFSLGLSQDGVTFLEGLYKDGAAPVGVVYELSFYGLRPAVEARVTANLSRLYQHFGGGLAFQYGWFKADIAAGLDFLREQGDISIELTSHATGEEAQKSKELAVSLFKDHIVQEMFRPIAAPPAAPGSGSLPGNGSTAASLTAAGSEGRGKAESTKPITLTLRYQRTEELKTVTYDFRERAPEERVHAPQAFLPALLTPTELTKRIHRIDLQNEFFQLLEVLVTGPTKAEFEALGIRQIGTTLTYGAPDEGVPVDTKTLLFRPDSTGDRTFAAKRRGRKSLAYTCALTYEFLREAGADADSFHYELPSRSFSGRAIQINPYQDFGVLDVELEPGRVHPDVKEIQVDLTYRSPDNRFGAHKQFRLFPVTPDAAPSRDKWQVRTLQATVGQYTTQYTFVFQDGTQYNAPPQQLTDRLLRVDSPFLHDRRLMIRPNVASPQIEQITVELQYQDKANKYGRDSVVTLGPPFATKEVSWPILDPNQQTVRYRVTVHEAGFIGEGKWEETSDPSIVVGAVGSRVAAIQVRLIGPPLTDAGLDALQVKIQPAIPGSSDGDTRTFLFDGGQTSQDIKLSFPPGTALRYRYQTTAFKRDGQIIEAEWKEMTSPLLVISTRGL